MGKCQSKQLDPPSILIERSSDEIRRIIMEQLRLNHTHIGDGVYGSYSLDQLKQFLKNDGIDKKKYVKNSTDCDNFALMLAGREAEWFSNITAEVGSTFGIIHGDIRKSEDSQEFRPHAVNMFIDDKGEVWLIEPQTDEIFKSTSNSSFWFCLL